MTQTVTARQDEPLDLLVWRATGEGPTALGTVLAANPGLASRSTALPEGTAVLIPDLPTTTATVDLVQLWD